MYQTLAHKAFVYIAPFLAVFTAVLRYFYKRIALGVLTFPF